MEAPDCGIEFRQVQSRRWRYGVRAGLHILKADNP
jgi:hypothetical protein